MGPDWDGGSGGSMHASRRKSWNLDALKCCFQCSTTEDRYFPWKRQSELKVKFSNLGYKLCWQIRLGTKEWKCPRLFANLWSNSIRVSKAVVKNMSEQINMYCICRSQNQNLYNPSWSTFLYNMTHPLSCTGVKGAAIKPSALEKITSGKDHSTTATN